MAEQNNTPVLSVNSGVMNIDVNDNGEVIGQIRFNPADFDIIKRYEEVVETMNSYTMPDNPTEQDLFQLSDKVKELTDKLLGYPVSDVLFGRTNPCSPIANGDLFFENVWEGIAALIESTMNKRIDKKIKKIKAATAKYHK